MPMPKPKTSVPKLPRAPLAIAPWIYINDPTETGIFAAKLVSLLPLTSHIRLGCPIPVDAPALAAIQAPTFRKTVVVVSDDSADSKESGKQASALIFQQAAIRNGCNFVSINLYHENGSVDVKKWGTNHLELCINGGNASVEDIAEKIYKWLFTVLSVTETLHLIPDEEMMITESNTTFKDYEYCPIAESRRRPYDAKIQFVALIVTKPVIGPNRRISWQVADKTGTANFYFQHRGASSQYTWDWVLSLQPGDRKSLPRMPMVEIVERRYVTVAKAPFRFAGAVVQTTGYVVKELGRGVTKVGSKIKLGHSREWVAMADVTTDSKGRKVKKVPSLEDDRNVVMVPARPKTKFTVFTEKGEKVWKDTDSVASTTAGSIFSEKGASESV